MICSGPLFRVTTYVVANLIGLVTFLEVFLYELPVAGSMADFGDCVLDSASQPCQILTVDHRESDIRAIFT